jgi:two-component system chemotaxis response regulator CheB
VTKRRVTVAVIERSREAADTLSRHLRESGDIDVLGSSTEASAAVALVERLKPDVITIDLHVSDGRGQDAIEQVMAYAPTPVLALSEGLIDRTSEPAVEALMAGALDAMPRPSQWNATEREDLRRRVRLIAGVPVIRHPRGRMRASAAAGSRRGTTSALIAVAASTGGPPALAAVVPKLVGVGASVLIVQHIHPHFVAPLAESLARIAPFHVKVAVDGERLQPDVAYVAPGDTHLRVSSTLSVSLDPEPATLHRPSADELFASLAAIEGVPIAAAVLTGMGADGAKGLLAIRDRGGFTVAQDEATSAVYGMPAAARRNHAAREIFPLEQIGPALVAAIRSARRRAERSPA